LIGSIRIKLTNEHGELQMAWSYPNRMDPPNCH
jgi:hypothetical protein